MEAPRHDTRGIVDPSGLLDRVRFRRHEPAEPLRRYVEWYWLIDWDLPAPYASHVVPHPSVNLTFQWDESDETEAPPYAEVTGVALGLYTRKLTGRGRVCGAKFRPGGFRPYTPEVPVSRWTGRALPAREVFAQITEDVRGHPRDTRLVPVAFAAAASRARPLHYNGPAMLRSLATATALAVVPPGGATSGADVQVLPLPWFAW